MFISFVKRSRSFCRQVISFSLVFTFIFNLTILPKSFAQINLSATAAALPLSSKYNPAIINGMTIYPKDPMKMDFIIDTGDDRLQGKQFTDEAKRLINYFFASLAVPEDEMWVNLSPTEKDRIIADGLSKTEMGRDMLMQDYLLKQLTASLMSPEGEVGRKFWERVYAQTEEKLGTVELTDILSKVWIVPSEAVVYVHDNRVFVAKSRLKVMSEGDYTKDERRWRKDEKSFRPSGADVLHPSSLVLKQTILPEIEREVNTGKTFAPLRQIYNSLILAIWYKKNLKRSLLGQIYVDQNKLSGIDLAEKDAKEKIYNQYLEAFKKGAYEQIREEYDPSSQQVIPRKYFSGGIPIGDAAEILREEDAAESVRDQAEGRAMNVVKVDVRTEDEAEDTLEEGWTVTREQIEDIIRLVIKSHRHSLDFIRLLLPYKFSKLSLSSVLITRFIPFLPFFEGLDDSIPESVNVAEIRFNSVYGWWGVKFEGKEVSLLGSLKEKRELKNIVTQVLGEVQDESAYTVVTFETLKPRMERLKSLLNLLATQALNVEEIARFKELSIRNEYQEMIVQAYPLENIKKLAKFYIKLNNFFLSKIYLQSHNMEGVKIRYLVKVFNRMSDFYAKLYKIIDNIYLFASETAVFKPLIDFQGEFASYIEKRIAIEENPTQTAARGSGQKEFDVRTQDEAVTTDELVTMITMMQWEYRPEASLFQWDAQGRQPVPSSILKIEKKGNQLIIGDGNIIKIVDDPNTILSEFVKILKEREYILVHSSIKQFEALRAAVTFPQKEVFSKSDEAPGGIDFNTERMKLQEEGELIHFDTSDGLLKALPQNIRGIRYRIIGVTPVVNFNLLLGLGKEDKAEQRVG